MSTDKPAQRKALVKPLAKNHVLVMHCEWETCEETFKSLDPFHAHVSAHIRELDPEGKFVGEGELMPCASDVSHEFSCCWRDCGSLTCGSFIELLRHVFFHVMHARVKSRGRLLMEQKTLPSCSLDSSTHNIIPDKLEAFKCHWSDCKCEFDCPSLFYRHIERHYAIYPPGRRVEGGCACLWTGCNAVVTNITKLSDHMRRHSQEKTVACPTCGGMFANNTKLRDHLHRQITSDPLTSKCFQCSHCNKQFSSERILRDHLRHHVNSYKCPLCEMTCPTPSGLRHHIHYRHANERPFKCNMCSYSGKRLRDLRLHTATHMKDTLHCGEADCSFECKLDQTLLAHYQREHSAEKLPRYLCHECGSIYSRGFILTKHLKKKHNFKWPAGHQRFNYKEHEDGFFRLQTIRYESIELSEQLLQEGAEAPPAPSPAGSYNLKMLGDVAAALREPAESSVDESEAYSDLESMTDCSEAVPSEDAMMSSPAPPSHGETSKRYFREVSISQSSDFSEDVCENSDHSIFQ
ncbi:hypothetical protein CAPTEDRAFT_150759 [Capitella teleta]|uniref:C2H2-type domain-containing protein n=1 Tax=Capitella teleta TaxID=283909 RepID=R7VM28_CAPTE|nr:hypothetical protein CAPTEDRAFT_150759 [Capitella teleta]|eukprot:ELU18130.1 hypothetical protein CAPTEDRAFT_150759 [Capitella teleta]